MRPKTLFPILTPSNLDSRCPKAPSLDALVTGFAKWHINSDEPEFELEQSSGTPFRASDHDPFGVGIKFPQNPQLPDS